LPLEFVKNFKAVQTSHRKYSSGQRGLACSLHFTFHLKSALQIDSLAQGEGSMLVEVIVSHEDFIYLFFLHCNQTGVERSENLSSLSKKRDPTKLIGRKIL
jgi:hypothetical protein